MNVRIAPTVVNETRWHAVLDAIVEVIMQPNSHCSFDVTQYREIISGSWLRDASGPRANIAELIRSATRTAGRSVPVSAITLEIDSTAPFSGEISGANVMRFQPLKALAVLTMPLQVIVEDETSDGGFVLWMARLLGKDSLRSAYNAGRITFRHAGGKTQMVKAARAISYGIWARENRPIATLKLRAVAILDSDSRSPGDHPNKNIQQQLKPYLGFSHVLEARTIENYVPKQYALSRLRGQQKAVEAYFRLTEVQRQYFSLKRGYPHTSAALQAQSLPDFLADRRWSKEEKNLFRQVPVADWAQFSGGFGDSLSDVYSDSKYRCSPSQPHLLTPAQQTELNRVLKMIMDFI